MIRRGPDSYIELNPVLVGLVEHPRAFPWSSHGANAFGERDSLVSPHEVYGQLGRHDAARQAVYRGFFDGPLDETTVTTIRDATQKGWTLGSKKFRQEIATLVGRRTDALRVWQSGGSAGQGTHVDRGKWDSRALGMLRTGTGFIRGNPTRCRWFHPNAAYRGAAVALALLCSGSDALAQRATVASDSAPFVTVGLFIASIEEGARIFTPVRLLPFDHPEALNHQFPTVLQFHGGEDRLLITLGRSAGLLLGTTLQRYPTEPDTAWPYAPIRRPPAERFESVSPRRKPAANAPLPGLRAVAYLDGFPLAFIVDTRGMSLAARHMDRPTSSGVDVTRAQLQAALAVGAQQGPSTGAWLLVYERP